MAYSSELISNDKLVIDRGSTGSWGQLTPLFEVGVKEYLLTPAFIVYNTCLLPRLGHYACTINAIHSVHYAHNVDIIFMSYNPCVDRYSETGLDLV